MFRSVFSRMLATYIVISILTMVVLALVLSFALRGVLLDKQFELMRRNEETVSSLIEQSQSMEIGVSTMLSQLKTIAVSTRSVIWLLDVQGRMLRITGDENDSSTFAQNTLEENLNTELTKVLGGEEIATTGIFDAPLNAPVMTVGRPISLNGEIVGAVLIHVRLAELDSLLSSAIMNITFSALLAIALSVILVYFTSLRISRPLSQIGAAAREIARGNLDKRVKTTGEDEIGELAMSFNRMVDKIQSQEAIRRGFVANVSHELRSPLTSIQGFVQGILDGTIPAKQRDKYLKTVLSETKRLGKLINDLLDLSQFESGKLPLNITEFDVNEMLRRVLITFEGRIDAKALEVNAQFAGEKLLLKADADRMIQVLNNLLDNAVKFSRHGGRLFVRTRKLGREIRISIADEGAGIPAKDLPHIWERFYQAEDTARDSGEGTGLGLSIAQKIISQHGGRIRVRSCEGAYTVFVISLFDPEPKVDEVKRRTWNAKAGPFKRTDE
jgi:signal transduction histidine kinase